MYLNKSFKYLFVILLLFGFCFKPIDAFAEEVDDDSIVETVTEKVKVTIDVNGGVELDKNEFEVDKGTLLKEVIDNVTVTNENAGIEFDGFYDLAIDGNKYTGNEELSEDITIYAHWKEKEVPQTRSIPNDNNEEEQQPVVDNSSVRYSTHVQNIGWQNFVSDGAMAGTSGRSLRLEGIKIEINNNTYTGDVLYRTHIQNRGW